MENTEIYVSPVMENLETEIDPTKVVTALVLAVAVVNFVTFWNWIS